MEEDFVHNKFGWCYFRINEVAFIYNLYIHHKWRRRGKAEMLLHRVVYEIRTAGYKGQINIEVAPTEKTISYEKLAFFYQRMGLTVVQCEAA
jgi:GNAT superfamily N-acetyltransferase